MTQPRAYIICTSPRSGSTLLCNLLAATGKAGSPNSHFHTPSLSGWRKAYGISRADFTDDRESLRAVFAAALRKGTGDTDLFGLRMQRGSFGFFIQQAGILYPAATSERARIEAAFGATLFIHLTRTNKLDQAISCVKAMQTGLWHRAADGRELERLSASKEPVYDAEQIAQHVAEFTSHEAEWTRWFARERLTPLRVSYDALSDNPQAVLAEVLAALGLDPEVARGIKPSVAKLADAVNQDWAARFLSERGDR